MDALDGNAIAGTLFAVFGREMTTASGTCASCGTTSLVGELRVYLSGPGTVVHCPRCATVVMVLAEIGSVMCLDLSGLASLELSQ